MPGVVAEVARALSDGGVDLESLALAWARAAPVVALVPAFGLRALPFGARAIVALALAASIAPAAAPPSVLAHATPWGGALALEALAGLPIAVATAVPLWAATMAGGVADTARGAGAADATQSPTVEGRATPTGVLLSLLACAIFFATGGATRVAAALAAGPASNAAEAAAGLAFGVATGVASALVTGLALAVALAGPVLAATVVIDVGTALVARAASPAQLSPVLAPVRALTVLAVLAVSFERIAAVLAAAQSAATGAR